jgi:transposase InsO family protein
VSKNRVIVSSVVFEGRSKSEVARDYGISRRWVQTLVSRYLAGGWDAVEARSRRPKGNPRQLDAAVAAEIVRLRRLLTQQGLDAGAHTIGWHLGQTAQATVPAESTIWKVLVRAGLVTPQPKKRPRSSYLRFEADLPNETWQSDFTHWRLSHTRPVEVLTFLDDHSRYALSITAHDVVTGQVVVADFRTNIKRYGAPASTLTDNGLVFTTRVRHGMNAFENELRLLGITQKNGRPNHPQTQGKVERFQQTLKKWLSHQATADTLADLQTQLDTFRDYYNDQRPHRALDRTTPARAYHARGKATPTGDLDGHWRIREDRVDKAGVVTIRYHSRLHHIGIGRPYRNRPIKMLIHDRHIRIIDPTTGELIRELTLNPDIDYQPQNPRPKETEL